MRPSLAPFPGRRASLALLLCLPAGRAAELSTPNHLDLRRQALAAYERKDHRGALELTRQALQLRPDSPRYLYNCAALSALLDEPRAAIGYLERLAALRVVMPIERDRDFARLQGTPELRRVLQLFAANAAPVGAAERVAELPGRTGIIEGIAYRARTRDWFLSDVHHRCIWRRDHNGQVMRFTEETEELFGVFGLAIDETRQRLWAATTALPEMAGFQPDLKGLAALAEFDLATGELRRIVPVPVDGREHGLGDLTVGPDGTVYASDSKAPVIWRLAADGEELEKVVDSPSFGSLQGLALIDRTLVVADYANGLLAIELATGNATLLTPPKDTTLVGIDGVVAIPGGVVVTQNGVEPQRVLHLALSPTADAVVGAQILASGLPDFTDLTLLTLANDQPTVVAGAGWDGFDPAKSREPPPHTVRLFQVPLP